MKIIIGVPTYQRPLGLKKLLESLAKQKTSHNVCVLVADNEGEEGVGLRVVCGISKAAYPHKILGIPVPEKGLSYVRNALLVKAFEGERADVLVMVDDDQHVAYDWLNELLSPFNIGECDVVGGAVIPEFTGPPPKWSRGLKIYWRETPSSGPVSQVFGAGNVAIHRKVYESSGRLKFDSFFNATGGEDKAYFCKLKEGGAKFEFNNKALAYEVIPESRAKKKWALQRALRIGMSDAEIEMIRTSKKKYIAHNVGRIFTVIFVRALLLCVLFWHPCQVMKQGVGISRQVGKLYAVLGFRYNEYDSVHGE